ncbi:MAG: hypothetical protein WB711_08340 [Terriglobales bacterium]
MFTPCPLNAAMQHGHCVVKANVRRLNGNQAVACCPALFNRFVVMLTPVRGHEPFNHAAQGYELVNRCSESFTVRDSHSAHPSSKRTLLSWNAPHVAQRCCSSVGSNRCHDKQAGQEYSFSFGSGFFATVGEAMCVRILGARYSG